jgi:hypothetical protein
MKRKLRHVIVFILFWIITASAQAQTWQWAAKAGGPGNDYANAIDIDNSGNSYVTGKFRDSISFNSITLINTGTWSVFIAKFDVNGNFLWAKIAASDSIMISVSGISLDKTGDICLTGQYFATATFGISNLTSSADYDVYVAKYDTSGDLLWARSAGGPGIDYAGGVSTDKNGNVFITGDFHITSFPFSASKIFLAKYDGNGNSAWFKMSLNNSLDHFGNGIKTDSVGNSFITGEFFDTLIFDSAVVIDAGNVESNGFLAKFDSSGNILWGQKVGAGSGYCGIKAIDIDSAGNSYVTGYYHGTIFLGTFSISSTLGLTNEIFVAKCDTGGNFSWVNRSTGAGLSRNICVDNTGNVFIGGTFSQTNSFGLISLTSEGNNDVFAAETDPSGNFVWAASCGGLQNDNFGGLKINSNGIFLTGYFTDTIHFGTSLSLVDTSTNTDIFLTKLSNAAGIKNEEVDLGISVFPNPAIQQITILTNEMAGELIVSDFLGRKVLQKKSCNEKQITLDISFLYKGIYLLEFKAENREFVAKVVKE